MNRNGNGGIEGTVVLQKDFSRKPHLLYIDIRFFLVFWSGETLRKAHDLCLKIFIAAD